MLIDRFDGILGQATIEGQKENLVQYSELVGTPKKKLPDWKAEFDANESFESRFPVIDFVHVTHWEDKHAEICFMNYSQGMLGDLSKAGESAMAAWGVALIRCEIDLQRRFLHDLYEG
jgi:hypothetical protein